MVTRSSTAAGRRAARMLPGRFVPIRSAEEFRHTLLRERARSDRSGLGFSLIAYKFANGRDGRRGLPTLAEILAGRLRLCDEVGYLGRRRLGAMLPCTSPEGARRVVEDVEALLPDELPRPDCRVFAYPSDVPPSELRPASRRGGTDDLRPAYPMEPLFFARLPLWKRVLDVTSAAVGLVVLAPLFGVVAVAIKATSPGPVFFPQKRGGLGGKPFTLYKFRSMVSDAEARKKDLLELNEQDGPAFKIKNDPRVTPLGRLLRATSIDELPQLWNVLRGDMSLVGPRPLPCHESEACHGWHRRRLDVTPGLTCIWQVRGRSRVTFDEWMRMDVRYIRSRTVFHDLKLLWQTVGAVLRKDGS